LGAESETDKVQQVLINYVNCIHNSSPEVRQKTAAGLKDLAGYFIRAGAEALPMALSEVAKELANEKDSRLQNLITATFVLLGQEAATRRRYPAVLELMSLLDSLEKSCPAIATGLRERVGLENRVPDFLEEVLHLPEASGDLVEVLRRMSAPAVEHLAGKVSRRARRRERDRLVKLAEQLGATAVEALRKAFSSRPPAVSVTVVGLLARLDPAALEPLLPTRLHEWSRVYQDAVVRQIASSGAPSRGMLLARILDHLDPLVVPVALDEIGMNGDPAPAPLLLGIAAAHLPKFASPFIRVKAIEALGRLRVKEAAATLQQLLESPELRRDGSVRELRIAAAQSLQKIDPQAAKSALAGAGIRAADLDPIPFDPDSDAPGVRQRYYPRVKLRRALSAKISTADGDFSASIRQLSLGGGLCSCEHRLLPGTPATIRIKTGLRSFTAELFLRDARSEMVAFEIVDMNLEDRSRLRTVLQAARG
jgi:PilZ domain